MVKTADGYKAIAHIQAGDRVLSKDEASGKTGYKPVTAQYGNPYQETVYIKVSDGIGNSQTLISNRIHPFYSGGKWIKAEDLKAGSRLYSESGRTQTVRNTIVKPTPLKAYNLTVADWHTYFVKGNQAETEGVWVHNDCPYGGSNNLEKAKLRAERLSKNDRAGKDFTKAGKEAVIDLNRIQNNGQVKCANCGIETIPAKQSIKNISPTSNERQVDHVIPKSKGGQGTPKNGQVLCRGCNIKKSNK
ncbi:TPA: polymorphic toxin-type HINT domain-containing protein [Neisseria gonorrhoeae]